ncbi:MAG: hypothetical protein ACRD37_12035, partial [Candidatus Acidiferrales bacterium]
GIGRAALLGSLACRGDARIRDAQYYGIDLDESVRAGARRPGITNFPAASADFSCADGQVRFAKLNLENQNAAYNASGYVDFKRQMNLEFSPLSGNGVAEVASHVLTSVSPNAPAHPVTHVRVNAPANPPVAASANASTKKDPVATFQLSGPLKSPAIKRIP